MTARPKRTRKCAHKFTPAVTFSKQMTSFLCGVCRSFLALWHGRSLTKLHLYKLSIFAQVNTFCHASPSRGLAETREAPCRSCPPQLSPSSPVASSWPLLSFALGSRQFVSRQFVCTLFERIARVLWGFLSATPQYDWETLKVFFLSPSKSLTILLLATLDCQPLVLFCFFYSDQLCVLSEAHQLSSSIFWA